MGAKRGGKWLIFLHCLPVSRGQIHSCWPGQRDILVIESVLVCVCEVSVFEFVELRGKSLAPHFLSIRLHMTLADHRERIKDKLLCVEPLCGHVCG